MSKKIGVLAALVLLLGCKNGTNLSKKESVYYTDSLFSNYLKEYRKHNVYLPRDFNNTKNYPIIYATDGDEIKDKSFVKTTLDSLINNKKIKPIVYIASHSNKKIADSTSTTTGDGKKVHLMYRNFEYVDYKIPKEENKLLYNRFENHKLYFTEELIPRVESKISLTPSREDRYFYGVSNGAGFGMSLFNSNPKILGTYFCLSVFGGDIQKNDWESNIEYPKLFLRYGKQEPSFLKDDAEFLKIKFKKLGLFYDIKEFDGGHDHLIWRELFSELLIQSFEN